MRFTKVNTEGIVKPTESSYVPILTTMAEFDDDRPLNVNANIAAAEIPHTGALTVVCPKE